MARGTGGGRGNHALPHGAVGEHDVWAGHHLQECEALPLGEPIVALDDLTVSDWRLEVKDGFKLLAGEATA